MLENIFVTSGLFSLQWFIVTGFTLVICPLISLMEDQLMVLEQLGISAALLNASSSKVCLTA